MLLDTQTQTFSSGKESKQLHGKKHSRKKFDNYFPSNFDPGYFPPFDFQFHVTRLLTTGLKLVNSFVSF